MGSNNFDDLGATLESLKKPKYANKKMALYRKPYLMLLQACTNLVRIGTVMLALYLGK